jgi:hypothetical protein
MADLPPLPEGFRFVEQSPLPPLPSGYKAVDEAPQEPPKPKSYAASEVLPNALGSFLPSLGKQVGEMVEGVGNVIMHPVDTAAALGRLVVDAAVPGVAQETIGALATKLGADKGAVRDTIKWLREPANGMADDLKKAYGDWDSVKRTLAEDPARVLMDVSTIATGGQLALAKAPGVAGKVGRVAGKVADWTDPLTVATKGVANVVEPLSTGWLGVNSGVTRAPIREAARTGFAGGQEGIDFRRAFRGEVEPQEIVARATEGVTNMKRDAQRIYAARKDDPRFGWGQDTKPLNFAPITQAWKDTVDSLTTKAGKRKVGDAEWNQIQKVGDVVSEWESDIARGVIKGTADDLDGLKQRIRAIYPDGEAPQLRRVVTKMANVVGDQVRAQVPGYWRAMKDYAEASDHLWEIERAFATGEKSSMQTALSKLQSVMRNNAQTQYGLRDKLLDSVENDGRTSIRPLLAGNSLNSWESRGLARLAAPTGLPAAAAALTMGLPGAAAIGLAGYGASVPKIVGGAAHTAGRIAGLPDRAAEMLAPRIGGRKPPPGFFYDAFGRGPRLGARALGMATGEDDEARARGGYFGGYR